MSKAIQGFGLDSYGDSFTVGGNATNNYGFSQMLAATLGGAYNNYGVGSTGTTDAVKKAHLYCPRGNRMQVVSVMSGLNDIRSGGMAALEKVENNTRAFIAACLTRSAKPASSLVAVGAWSPLIGTQYGGRAFALNGTPMTTTDTDAYLEYKFYGDSFVCGAYATSGLGHYQDLAITIDDAPTVPFELLGHTNNTASFAAKVIDGLGVGAHVARIYSVNSKSATVVDYVGTLMPKGAQAPVLVGKVPYLKNWAQYASIATQEIADAASLVIERVCSEFCDYGVVCVDPNAFYDPATQCSSDGIHPLSVGHSAIAKAFVDSIEII